MLSKIVSFFRRFAQGFNDFGATDSPTRDILMRAVSDSGVHFAAFRYMNLVQKPWITYQS